MGTGTGVSLPRVGEILRDKYELTRTLGEGGMAVVFEGRNKDSGQRVAVKVLAPELTHDAEIVARFDREARAVGRLRTRHVAHVVEVAATDAGLPFIVMDFLDGRDLASELESRKTLPIEEAIDYVLQTCAAMDEAHRAGVVHRDLKPANLFLTYEGEDRIVKVLDFGISKLVGESSKLTGAGAVMGTVVYMSPEQVRSSTDVDQRADVWSLGVILFELLTGRAPFEGPAHKVAIAIVSERVPDIRTLAPDVPDELAFVIKRMLEHDRAARFANIIEAATALAPFAHPESVGANVVPSLGRDLPPRGRAATAGQTMPFLQKRTVPLGFRALGKGFLSGESPPSSSSSPASGQAGASSQSFAQTMKMETHAPPSSVDAGPLSRDARAADTLRKKEAANGRRSSSSSSSRLATIAGAAFGLLAAGGVVFVWVVIEQRDTQTTLPAPSAGRFAGSSEVTPSSSIAPPFLAASSTVTGSTSPTSENTTTTSSSSSSSLASEPLLIPPPPPTGTNATMPTSSSSANRRRADAGVPFTPTTSTQPSANPTLL